MYGSVAIAGFLMFGEQSLSQITLNMPEDAVASKVALLTVVSVHWLVYFHGFTFSTMDFNLLLHIYRLSIRSRNILFVI